MEIDLGRFWDTSFCRVHNVSNRKPRLEYLDGSRKKFQKLELYWATITQKLVSRTQNAIGSVSMWLHNCRWQEVWCESSGKQCFMLEKLTQSMRPTSPPNLHFVTSVSGMKSAAVGVFIPEKWANMKSQDLLFSFPFLFFPLRDPVCQHTSTLMERVKTFVNYDSKEGTT